MDINDLLLKYKDELPKEYTDELIEKSYPVSSVIKMFIDYNNYLKNNTNFDKILNMKEQINFGQALEALNNGKKVKVPEWKGYWFKESGMIKVMTAEGQVLETPHFQQYIFRTDWEIID